MVKTFIFVKFINDLKNKFLFFQRYTSASHYYVHNIFNIVWIFVQ